LRNDPIDPTGGMTGGTMRLRSAAGIRYATEGTETMKSAAALSLLAVGAIFAFAVKGHPWFLNFQVLGWVLILTAIAGLVIPRRGRGWLRRTVLVKEAQESEEAKEAGKSPPMATAAESGSTQAQGHVESESIVEFIER
jgi:hypothetical protein